MLPPIPSPYAHDCPNCGTPVYEARTKYCPHCGAALKSPSRIAIGNIIGACVLGVICLPMGACSIVYIGTAVTTASSEIPSSAVAIIALFPLMISALGITWMIKLLRKK